MTWLVPGRGSDRDGEGEGGGGRRLLRVAVLAATAALVVAAGVWMWRAHREIEETWRRKGADSPSRVYAASTPLYPGREMARTELVRELRARGYREIRAGDPEPGQFRREAGGVSVHLRDFRYPEPRGRVAGPPLHLRFTGGRIRDLRHLRTGARVPDAELEPRRIATLVGTRAVQREPVPLERMPPELIQAVLAVEDRRFFRHPGLDPVRVAGAAMANLRAGRRAQGGSTLTQQLVRTYYLTPEKSLDRKLREAAMALLLEWEHDKEAILQAYLNAVYLGQAGAAGVVGVGPAARRYFGRDVSELGLAGSALLAGMIRAPNRYAPHRHPGAARSRRDLVLRLMEEQGRITPGERRRAAREPVPAAAADVPEALNRAPWFVDYVQRELEARFSRRELRRKGLRIHTTLDPSAQAAAERAVRQGLAAVEARHPELAAAPDPGGGSGTEAGGESADGTPRLQAALVAMDPRTGDVLAMVGGRSFRRTQFNRAVQARRQPGSLFKPFVYLAALADTADGAWTLASRISDSTFAVRAGGERWSPSNYDGESHGRPTLREALEESYNVATARLAREIGLPRVAETARRLGLSSPLRPVPSLALGAFEVSPLEMTSAYAALAGSGIRPEPLSVTAVTRPDGARLEARELSMRRVAPAGPVHLVNRALQGVLDEGTGARARQLGYPGPAAGKTGTTSGYRDAWFVGYTPDLVALVWVGYDDNRTVGLSGAEAALPLWVRFVGAYGARGDAGFRTPPGVTTAGVRRTRGGSDGECREEYFLEGTVPDETCGEGWWIF